MAFFRQKKEEAHESALYTSLNEKIQQKEQERPQQPYDTSYESNEDEVEFPDLKEESNGKLDFDHLFDGEPDGKVDVFDTDYTEDEIQDLMELKTSDEEVIERVRNKVREKFGDRILSERKDEKFQVEISKAILEALMDEGGVVRDVNDRDRLHTRIFNLIVGLGPLELLFNQGYSEIMVSRYDKIFVEEKGKMKLTNVRFSSEEELRQIVDQILAPLGRTINDASPMVDGRLEDGSRFNVVIPPIAVDGTQLTIRRFPEHKITAQQYLEFGSLNEVILKFFEIIVRAQFNGIVSGGTGSGKTTLLNLLSNFLAFDPGLAVATIEDSCELQINHPNVRRYETRNANASGVGAVTSRQLVKNAMRIRPDSIIIGEIRDGTMADFLRIATSGHDGCLTTLHNESPRELENTIQVLFQMAEDYNFTEAAISRLYCAAVDVIIQIKRFPDHVRRITHVTHVVGYGKEGAKELGIKPGDPDYDPHECYIRDIFVWEPWGFKDGKFYGDFVPTGYVPKRLIEKARDHGVMIDEDMFVRKQPKHTWNDEVK